jgi:hypothetical protein
MSYRDLLRAPTGHPEVPVRSVAESERFGVSIGRMTVSPEATYGVAEVIEAIEASGLENVVLRYPAEHIDWFWHLATGPFRAIHAESLYVLRNDLPIPPDEDPDELGIHFEIIDAERWPMLIDALEPAFRDHRTHYAAIAELPSVTGVQVYDEWIRSLIGIESAQVAVTWMKDDPCPVGFSVSEAYDFEGERYGEFLFIGVRPNTRRRRVSSAIADHTHEFLTRQGARTTIASIRASNLPSINLTLLKQYRPIVLLNTAYLSRH